MTHQEIVAVCQRIAPIVRSRISEKSDRWAAAITTQRISGGAMGSYYLGWADHVDEWEFFSRQTNHDDWLALHQHLEALLSVHGPEKPKGDDESAFSLSDEDDGRPGFRLANYRIEF